MAINIEMSIKQNDSNYETLYPKTLGSLVDGKVSSASVADTATSLNSTLAISKGGTNGTSPSSALYNLISQINTRSASSLNSYASTTYIPCYYSTTAYKFSLSNIMTYVNNNVKERSCIEIQSYVGTGSESGTTKVYFSGKTGMTLKAVYYRPFPLSNSGSSSNTSSGGKTANILEQMFLTDISGQDFNTNWFESYNSVYLNNYTGRRGFEIVSTQYYTISNLLLTIDNTPKTNHAEITYYCIGFYI